MKIHTKFCLKHTVVALALAYGACGSHAWANPSGGTVVNGSATFATTGNTLTVTNTPNTIINWQGFSIGAGETTRFTQPSSASAVLNRVTTQSVSSILGNLQSNGRVFLVNPNGILFSAGAQVNTAGFTATTVNYLDSAFLAGIAVPSGAGSTASFDGLFTANGNLNVTPSGITTDGSLSFSGNVLFDSNGLIIVGSLSVGGNLSVSGTASGTVPILPSLSGGGTISVGNPIPVVKVGDGGGTLTSVASGPTVQLKPDLAMLAVIPRVNSSRNNVTPASAPITVSARVTQVSVHLQKREPLF